MASGAWWLAAAMCACVPVDPAEDMFAPRPEGPAAAPAPVSDRVPEEPPPTPEGEEAEGGPLTPALIYEGTGLGSAADLGVAPEPPQPPPAQAVAQPPAPQPPPSPASWVLDDAVDRAFGVWLVSTVVDAHPPRAILAVAEGGERVVRAGTLLPEAGVVVLAVGRDAVQIAQVSADGDRATVETRLLRAMYP